MGASFWLSSSSSFWAGVAHFGVGVDEFIARLPECFGVRMHFLLFFVVDGFGLVYLFGGLL